MNVEGVSFIFIKKWKKFFGHLSTSHIAEEISDCNNIHYSHKLLQNSYFPGLRILNLICNQSLFLTAHMSQCGLPVVVGKCLCPMKSFGIQFFKINFY